MGDVEAIHKGLSASPKRLDNHTLMCDEIGSELFDKVTTERAYYCYRNDFQLIRNSAKKIASLIGRGVTFTDIGCAMCSKSKIILKALEDVEAFYALDIDTEVLKLAKQDLAQELPTLHVETRISDFMHPLPLPSGKRFLGLFAGSTIAVYSDTDVGKIVKNILESMGPNCVLLVSFDTNQDPNVTSHQYMTPSFKNLVLNALPVMNREFNGDFNREEFHYECRWNEAEKQVEHTIISNASQIVTLDGKKYCFEKGEPMRLFYGKKRSVEDFSRIVAAVGGVVRRSFFDDQHYMALCWIEPKSSP